MRGHINILMYWVAPCDYDVKNKASRPLRVVIY